MGGSPICLHRRKSTVIPGSRFRAEPTTKTEMKDGTIQTTTLRMGGPYVDHSACYDAMVVADRTAGDLASFRGGPDDFKCKSLTDEAASSISAGNFGR